MAKNKRDDIDSFSGMFTGNESKEQEQPPEKIKGRPKEDRETKKRVSLAILPSVYENVGKIAYVERNSISETVSNLLESYVEQNQDKIKEYDKLKK